MVETRNSRCRRLFAQSCRFDATPLVGVRRTAWRNALREWEWFMSGSSDINDLHESVRHWWAPWADEEGYIKYNYSEQLCAFGEGRYGFDQIAALIDGIKGHPFSRRHVITTWNPKEMAAADCLLTNCHNTATQFFVEPDHSLHLVTYQRSADVVCGLPHNLIQEWAFLLWVAHRTEKAVGSLTWFGGDVHLYECHTELAQRMIAATPGGTPCLVYRPTSNEFRADDFTLDAAYVPVLEESASMVV